MRGITLTVAALLLAGPLPGQAARLQPPGWAFGASIGRFSIAGGDFLETTLHISGLRPGKLTPEFDVGLYPQFLRAGGVVLTPDLGLAYNAGVPGAILLLKAGASGIFALSGNNGAALPGFHGGAALIVPVASGLGLRFEGLYRGFLLLSGYGPVGSFSAGIGITSLPRR